MHVEGCDHCNADEREQSGSIEVEVSHLRFGMQCVKNLQRIDGLHSVYLRYIDQVNDQAAKLLIIFLKLIMDNVS